MMTIPEKYARDTREWILCPADEEAARKGMIFDFERGAKVCNWIETNCYLYEGEKAGQPIVLLKAWRQFFMRLFGWVRYSQKWDCWIRRFRRFGFWGAKKNGKSPVLAALCTYLLCGDGEQGNKVYMGASNGDQARISQLHTINMIRQSPALADLCKINNTTFNIDHIPSNSRSIIITGDNQKGAKAKEGFNGSVLFDEMHVVPSEMWRRVSRAGISRKQPLLGSVSTSGDDRTCIGFEWMKQGRDAAANRKGREDLQFLHVEYTIPDDVTDLEIATEPEKYLPLANPAWGEIIDPEEIINDCRVSFNAGGPEWNKFLQYRANRWINSANSWISTTNWEYASEEFDLESLRKRDCYLGIDLARRLDMVGTALVFPWPEGPAQGALLPKDHDNDFSDCLRVWPMCWLNEDTIKLRDPVHGLMRWAQDGFLYSTKGNTTDFSFIKKKLRETVFNFELNLKGIFFDKTYAEEFTQQLVDGETAEDGTVIADGFGCPRIAVPQNIIHLTAPSAEFERRVKKRMIRHPGNPVLDWQVGNVEVYTDVNQNIRPIKPLPSSGKSVDLILAIIMGIIGVTTMEDRQPSVYRISSVAPKPQRS